MAELMTAAEVAVVLRMSRKTVYKLAKAGELPGRKLGGQWRFNRKRVKGWSDARI